MAKPPPDLDYSTWTRAVYEALDVTQEEFAERVRAEGGRDTVTKWWKKKKPTEPGFTYTRRLVLIAPERLRNEFLGKPATSDGVSDPDRKVSPDANGENNVTTPEGIMVGRELDEIEDIPLRKKARTAALAAIDAERSKSNPSELGAGKKGQTASSGK